MIHQLKTKAEFYSKVANGLKTFEVRNNDRKFQVGDTLILCEFDSYKQKLTDRFVVRYVSLITDYEQKPGFVVLGLSQSPTNS